MTSKESSSRRDDDEIDRLADALDAYLQRPAGENEPGHLEAHDELADLLGPMLFGSEGLGEGADGEGSDSATSTGSKSGDALPRFLGDYEVVREVGRGGMGVVYEAMQMSLGRRVALKVLPAHLTMSGRQIERFRREAAAIAKLAHPGIVQVYGVEEQDGVHFFAMEFVDGGNLADVIRERRDAFSKADTNSRERAAYFTKVANWVAAAAEALDVAHEQGIVHRDVKPQNLLLDEQGALRVVDFGLCKDIDEMSMTATSVGGFVGTPQYTSPEQAAGQRDLDARSDVFSLGVALYELLTLRRPFVGESTQEVLDAVQNREPRAPRRVDATIPRDLETICLKALEKEPSQRYASAAELAEDLQRWCAGWPIHARPVGPLGRGLRWMRRHRAPAAAALLLIAIGVLAPIALARIWRLDHDLEKTQTVAKSARKTFDNNLGALAESQLADAPGMQLVRRDLLEKQLAFHERYLRTAGDDPTAKRDVANARVRFGRILVEFDDVKRAVPVLQRAIRELEGLDDRSGARAAAQTNGGTTGQSGGGDAASKSSDVLQSVQAMRARAQDSLARALFTLGRYDEGQAANREAIEGLKALVESHGGDHRLRLRLGLSQLRAVIPNQRLGRIADARAAIKAVRSILSKVPKDLHAVPNVRAQFAQVDLREAALELSCGQLRKAEQTGEAARKSFETLLDEYPGRHGLTARLADTLDVLASVAKNRGRHVRAVKILERSIVLREQLVRDFGKSDAYRSRLAWAYAFLGLRRLSAKLEGAETATRKGVEIAEKLHEAQPEHGDHRQSYGKILNAHGICVRHARRNPRRALRAFRKAIEVLRPLVEKGTQSRKDLEHRSQLGAALNNAAEAELAVRPTLEGAAVAKRLILEAIPLQRRAYLGNPGNRGYRSHLWNHYFVLAELEARGGTAEAVATAAEGMRELANSAPTHEAVARQFARAAKLAKGSDAFATYAKRSVACLRDAIDLGFAGIDGLRSNAYYSALLGFAEFEEITKR